MRHVTAVAQVPRGGDRTRTRWTWQPLTRAPLRLRGPEARRPPARAGAGLTDGERRRCRRTQTRARASAEPLAHGPQHLRTGAAENRRGQGLALTIAPVQAQAIQARPEQISLARRCSALSRVQQPCCRAAWCSPGRTTTADGVAGRCGGVAVGMSGGTGPTGRRSPWSPAPCRSSSADVQRWHQRPRTAATVLPRRRPGAGVQAGRRAGQRGQLGKDRHNIDRPRRSDRSDVHGRNPAVAARRPTA